MNKIEKKNRKNSISILLVMMFFIFPIKISADVLNEYELGEVINAGEDTGFSQENEIDKDDFHFNWEIGHFSVKGYTRAILDRDKPIFLKTVGDNVVLCFKLAQNIDALNGDETLVIADDVRGYDYQLLKDETSFGRGALIIRKIDAYTNKKGKSHLYNNYLAAVKVGADTEVEVCEEGDYEVALDYSVEKKKYAIPFTDKALYRPTSDYRIAFTFSIRNGNCMVFPFDVVTGEELTNKTITENGFYLDLAKSKYLEINIKKEMLFEGESGLTEDVRFNKPASDGEKYTDEGIYTIKVFNPYTKEETIKKICVGSNAILKAYVNTGYSISDIQALVNNGATIDELGNIAVPTSMEEMKEEKKTQTSEIAAKEEFNTSDETEVGKSEDSSSIEDKLVKYMPILGVLITFMLFILYLFLKKKKKEQLINKEIPVDPEEVDEQYNKPMSTEEVSGVDKQVESMATVVPENDIDKKLEIEHSKNEYEKNEQEGSNDK